MDQEKRWYALYTKPRWEKKIDKLMTLNGLHSYCPLNKVRKKWSDRYKLVEEPLFKSYIFARLDEGEIQKARTFPGVLNFVYWNGKPAVVPDREIEVIRKFLNEFESVEAMPVEIRPRTRVMIDRGIMMGKEGEVVNVRQNTVEVMIDSLGYKLIAQVNKSHIVPLS